MRRRVKVRQVATYPRFFANANPALQIIATDEFYASPAGRGGVGGSTKCRPWISKHLQPWNVDESEKVRI